MLRMFIVVFVPLLCAGLLIYTREMRKLPGEMYLREELYVLRYKVYWYLKVIVCFVRGHVFVDCHLENEQELYYCDRCKQLSLSQTELIPFENWQE